MRPRASPTRISSSRARSRRRFIGGPAPGLRARRHAERRSALRLYQVRQGRGRCRKRGLLDVAALRSPVRSAGSVCDDLTSEPGASMRAAARRARPVSRGAPVSDAHRLAGEPASLEAAIGAAAALLARRAPAAGHGACRRYRGAARADRRSPTAPAQSSTAGSPAAQLANLAVAAARRRADRDLRRDRQPSRSGAAPRQRSRAPLSALLRALD